MSDLQKPPNRLLALLPSEEYQRLLPHLEEVPLRNREIIFEQGDVINDVYFPGSGVVSLLSAADERSSLEVGIAGSEGFIGLPIFLGVKTANNRAIVQASGAASKMKSSAFLAACKDGGSLLPILQRYTHSLITQISQSAACSRFHATEARLARWLLMTSDRMQSDEFQITQESLSKMLGVRREAVNKLGKSLQQKGLISSKRSKVTILDRAGVEAAACRCYFIINNEYRAMLEESNGSYVT